MGTTKLGTTRFFRFVYRENVRLGRTGRNAHHRSFGGPLGKGFCALLCLRRVKPNRPAPFSLQEQRGHERWGVHLAGRFGTRLFTRDEVVEGAELVQLLFPACHRPTSSKPRRWPPNLCF